MFRRKASLIWYVFIVMVLIFIITWTFFPMYWMLSTSIKEEIEVFNLPPTFWPNNPTILNYLNLSQGANSISRFLFNSVIMSLGTIITSIIFVTFAGYALSRFRFKFRRGILMSIIATQMFPLVILLVPLYLFYVQTRLLNTYIGLLIGFTSFSIPFGIWMMKGFVDSVPIGIEEAAMIDGCNRFQVVFKIVVPLIMPGLVAIAIYSFLQAWNNLLFPLTLINDIKMKTLPPGILLTFGGEFKHDWGGMMAASAITSIPVVIGFIFLQRYLVEGLTMGATKE
jgi:multiple sugar transport system permease protein